MSRWVELQAPAKINLRFRVLAREASGYHQVETVLGALDWGDRIRVEWDPSGAGVGLQVTGPEADGTGPEEENLASRAARSFLAASSSGGGVRISLEKVIPAGAGLGGGSADAGLVLRALNELVPEPLARDRLLKVAGGLGADVPFFLSPTPFALGWGRGDRILSLEPPSPAPVLLALPVARVETRWAYGLLGGEGERRVVHPGGFLFEPGELSQWQALATLATNDFEVVILPRFPVVGDVSKALAETGPILSLLSGSGSALFAVYSQEAEAQEARTELERRFPDVRFHSTWTRSRFPSVEAREEERTGAGLNPEGGEG